ncbi:MAG: SLBB domain-containing protein [Deltaproteobacteria bacterium]|nr:SLBB domain-containing protein [Deltaproteobacteria bacterium]
MSLKNALIYSLLFTFSASLFAQDFGLPSRSRPEEYDGSIFIPKFVWDPSFNFEDYELGPGDVLNMQLWGARNSITKIYVSANYDLFIPSIGPINVRGLSLGKLQEIFKKRITERYKNTQGSIALFSPREFIVPVVGAVMVPGEKPSTALIRLNEFILKNGGFASNASRVSLEIKNKRLNTKQIVNYQNYVLLGDYSGNPFLRDGDEIFVPFQKNVVTVKGDVLKPGKFEFNEQSIPLEKVVNEWLGGLTSTAVNSGQVVISRLTSKGSVTEYYDHGKFFDKKSPINFYNFEVKDGDQIFFPSASIQNPSLAETVFITGEVKLPAPQPYKAGLPLSSYISAAGGTTTRANYEQIVVYKASGSRVRLNENPTIEPGDTIYVPERTFKFWGDHLAILTALLSIATVTLSLSK